MEDFSSQLPIGNFLLPNSASLIRRARRAVSLCAIALPALLITTTHAAGTRGTTTGPEANAAQACCDDAPDYGNFIDFGAQPEGLEISNQFQANGVLFGNSATPLASRTYVEIDWNRPAQCRQVLNGDPPFAGWEFFVFADPVTRRWKKVQQVGANIGYCDRIGSTFIAAYDGNGDLLEAKFNETTGFQFLTIQRPSADISQVLVGDCEGTTLHCISDPAGNAMNCLTFSTPVATTIAMPDTVQVPEPPLLQGFPAAGQPALMGLGALLVAAAAFSLRFGRAKSTGA